MSIAAGLKAQQNLLVRGETALGRVEEQYVLSAGQAQRWAEDVARCEGTVLEEGSHDDGADGATVALRWGAVTEDGGANVRDLRKSLRERVEAATKVAEGEVLPLLLKQESSEEQYFKDAEGMITPALRIKENATQPEDWNEEEQGAWLPPSENNPEFTRLIGQLSTLKGKLKQKEEESRQLLEKLDHMRSFGGLFSGLQGRRWSDQQEEYTYIVEPFGKSAQQKDGSATNLGEFHSLTQAGDRTLSMHFKEGLACPGGVKRSLLLNFYCGPRNRLDTVTEPDRCAYQAHFETPASCDSRRAEEITQLLGDDFDLNEEIAAMPEPHDEEDEIIPDPFEVKVTSKSKKGKNKSKKARPLKESFEAFDFTSLVSDEMWPGGSIVTPIAAIIGTIALICWVSLLYQIYNIFCSTTTATSRSAPPPSIKAD